MLANYKGLTYIYIANQNISNIATNKKFKAIDDFVYKNNMYFRKTPPEELTDIFEISYWIYYDSGLSGLPYEWEVGPDIQDIKGNNILIRFSNGTIPNWIVEEKNISIKYINKDEVQKAKVIRTYKRKNGISLDTPFKEIKEVSVDELICTQIENRRNNL